MKKLLPLLLLTSAMSAVLQVSAQEDSCKANMQVTPDHNDPMTIHFCFDGVVPQGAFQFAGVWDFGDGNQSTDSCPVHTYAQPGNYLVCLTFSICIPWGLSCSDDTCQMVSVAGISGTAEINRVTYFFTYPNPVSSEFFVRTNTQKPVHATVRDLSGKILYRKQILPDNPIEASHLANGIYFIEIDDGNSILKRKLAIQR
jgi:hypothetical protein